MYPLALFVITVIIVYIVIHCSLLLFFSLSGTIFLRFTTCKLSFESFGGIFHSIKEQMESKSFLSRQIMSEKKRKERAYWVSEFHKDSLTSPGFY